MMQKTQTQKLVIATLSTANEPLKAIEIFEIIKQTSITVLHREGITTVRSFAQAIKTYPEVNRIEPRPNKYFLK